MRTNDAKKKMTNRTIAKTCRESARTKSPRTSAFCQIGTSIQTDAEEVALHIPDGEPAPQIDLGRRLGRIGCVRCWTGTTTSTASITVVNIVTWDGRALLQARRAFSVAGLNILWRESISRSDHIAIDTSM